MSWLIKNNKLQQEFRFESQTELALFITKIAGYADKVGHHPDMQIYKCSRLNIEIFTHDVNALTEKDYSLAEFIDGISIADK
ncbi:MAG: 4a-hydroxytetrahydrobiopterin dehydratase [Bacteroidota bacterium]